MSGLNTGVAGKVTKTAIDKVVMEGLAEYNSAKGRAYATDPIAFMQESTDRSAVISEKLQPMGYFTAKTEEGNVPTNTLRVGNTKTVLIEEFSNGFEVPRTFAADDQHSVVAEAARELALGLS